MLSCLEWIVFVREAVQDMPLHRSCTRTPILLACLKCEVVSLQVAQLWSYARLHDLFEKRVASPAESTFDHLHLLLCHIVLRV